MYMNACTHIRCYVDGLELRLETKSKSLALLSVKLWAFEVVLLKKLILRKMHLKVLKCSFS